MIKVLLSKKNKSLQVGDLIIEKSRVGCNKRIGEVVFIREGKMRKIQLIQLNNHDLSPVYNSDESRLKFFTLSENQCKILDQSKYYRPSKFMLGQMIKCQLGVSYKYGRIIGYLHPDGLYSDSYEKGHNGKDLLECVEISPRKGLFRKIASNGKPKLFYARPDRAKVCQVIPMNKHGGTCLEG
jgi:hypothetical protein